MKVLFFWEAVGGLSLEHRCNPYAGLLARELEKLDIHLELGNYDFERGWLEELRLCYGRDWLPANCKRSASGASDQTSVLYTTPLDE